MSPKHFTPPRLATPSDIGGAGADGLHPALVMLRERALSADPTRRERRTGWASLGEAWSHAASPPVMALMAYILVAATIAGPWPWIWTAVHVTVAVLFPLGVVLAMRRRGEVRDLELTSLRQRQGPLMLTFLASGMSLFVLETAVAPAPLVRLTLAYTVLGLALVLVSRHWKISVHCAGVAVAGTVLWRLHDAPLWLLAGLLTMAVARVALGRHTVTQTLAGSMLGVVITLSLAF